MKPVSDLLKAMDELHDDHMRAGNYTGEASYFFEPSEQEDAEAAYASVRSAVEVLIARNAKLEAKTAVTMGVGHGDGQHFVYGDYDSIKRAQEIILLCEERGIQISRLLADRSALAGRVRELKEDIAFVNRLLSKTCQWPDCNCPQSMNTSRLHCERLPIEIVESPGRTALHDTEDSNAT